MGMIVGCRESEGRLTAKLFKHSLLERNNFAAANRLGKKLNRFLCFPLATATAATSCDEQLESNDAAPAHSAGTSELAHWFRPKCECATRLGSPAAAAATAAIAVAAAATTAAGW